MKKDITTKYDIENLVTVFYERLRTDKLLSPYFSKIKDWEKFIETVKSFWENVLFFSGNYNGHPMELHKNIYEKNPFTLEHFQTWLAVFNATVDEMFEGANANAIKQRANNITTVMQIKILE
jgi:hemoglobin